MYSWETANFYSQFHPRWYESVDEYSPRSEHASVFREIAGGQRSLRRRGTWYVADGPGAASLPTQGWKIHVSAATANTVAVLQRVIPIMVDEGVTFKFIVDPQIAGMVNGKVWSRGASGKFITIYPESLDDFRRIGKLLAEALKDFVGPYILSDRRWPGSRCVFYRYGAFQSIARLRVDGLTELCIATPDGQLIVDQRKPYWTAPEWTSDPFDTAKNSSGLGTEVTLRKGRYTVTSALSYSARGGVYLADDSATGTQVVIKEARPHIEIGYWRIDAVAALEKEYRLLQALEGTGYFVRPLDFFHEWEHAFLVEEFLTGTHLGHYSVVNNPLYWTDKGITEIPEYVETMRRLWVQVGQAIVAAHERDIILADLSFTNVQVLDDGNIRIMDLDAAHQRGVDPIVGLFTPGVSSNRSFHANQADEADDFASLGSIMFGSIMLGIGIAGFHPPARQAVIRELRSDIGLTRDFGELVEDLCTSSATPGADAVHRVATTPIVGDVRADLLDDRDREPLRDRVVSAVAGVARYLVEVADTARTDRMFPADLMVFETNPCSVAYGAAGVLYALQRMTGVVPDPLLKWFVDQRITSDEYPPGLYLGQSGIAWVMAELGQVERAERILGDARTHELSWSSNNVLHGCSGFGLACLKLWSMGRESRYLDWAVSVGEKLLENVAENHQGNYWRDDDVVPLGYTLGGSGISLFLLYLHAATGDDDYLRVGRRALDFELSQAEIRSGEVAGFPASLMADGSPTPVLRSYWDAGSAGVLTTLVRYAHVVDDDALTSWIPRLARDVGRKWAVFPQLFHGLAGLGNVMLDVPSPGSAWDIASGVLVFGIERTEGLAFPGEQALRESADFATGAAGVGLFLHRLLQADTQRPAPNFNFVLDELLPSSDAHVTKSPAVKRLVVR